MPEPAQPWPKLSDEQYADFGKKLIDMVEGLGEAAEKVTENELKNFRTVDGFIQVWREQKVAIELLEHRLEAADEVMRQLQNYRSDEMLDAAVTHYQALRKD